MSEQRVLGVVRGRGIGDLPHQAPSAVCGQLKQQPKAAKSRQLLPTFCLSNTFDRTRESVAKLQSLLAILAKKTNRAGNLGARAAGEGYNYKE